MKKLMLFFVLMIFTYTAIIITFTNSVSANRKFADLQPGHWAEEAIYYLSELGLIDGYQNGKFGPDDKITRGQAALILMRELYPEEKVETSLSYSDVSKDNFYYQAIAIASDNGLFEGFPNGTFKPNEYISRAATAKILSIAYDLKGSNSTFTDLHEAPWASDYIKALTSNQVVNGYPDHTFKPNNSITRAEFSVALMRILDKSNKEEVIDLKPDLSEREFKFLELKTPYQSSDNDLTITMENIRTVDHGNFIEYIVSYTETNNTNDKVIDQGSFKIYFKDGQSELQSGLFKKLYPIESVSKTYIFKALKGEVDIPLFVEYGADLRSIHEPSEATLKWTFPAFSESDKSE